MSRGVLLGLPWYGLRRSLRVILALVSLAAWAAAFAAVHFSRSRWPDGWLVGAALLALWLALMGLLLSSTLLPALDARRLCLPRLQRVAVRSLLLNGALLLTLTATPLAVFSGHPAPVAEILLMGLAVGVAYGLWPLLWMFPLWLGIPLLQLVASLWHWRLISPLDPRFIEVCLAVVTVAVTVSARNWRRVLRTGPGELKWGMRPIILNFHVSRHALSGTGAALDQQIRVARQVPEWLLPQAAVGEAGPQKMPRALRVMLGGLYLPVTWRSRLRRLSVVGVIFASGTVFLLPLGLHAGWRWSAVRPFVALAFIFGPGMAMAVGTMARSQHLVQRWRRPGGELAVLALLPGLGGRQEQRARLLRLLGEQLRNWHAPLLALAVFAVLWLGAHGAAIGLLLLVLALAPLTEQAVIYSTLGRRLLPAWVCQPLLLLGIATYVGGLNVVALMMMRPGLDAMVPPLVVACAVCYGALLALAVRGQHALRCQAHPYLILE